MHDFWHLETKQHSAFIVLIKLRVPQLYILKPEKTVGQKITVSIKQPNGNGMTFKPKILKFDQNKEFRWLGKLGFTGIFDGEHYFILEQISDKQTKFIHGEKFSGILVMISGKMLDKTKAGFELMNQAIKKECEK
jgi:hypothetical protein